MIGQSIAHYKITAKLGEGGMGVVYRATDMKLNREVALKVLSEAFAQDPDRMARFQREAHVLASLNHPNIAAIYGLEERALVMELVEGANLADHRRSRSRVRKGNHTPRPEAGQHQDHARRSGEGARLRVSQGDGTTRAFLQPRPVPHDDRRSDAPRRGGGGETFVGHFPVQFLRRIAAARSGGWEEEVTGWRACSAAPECPVQLVEQCQSSLCRASRGQRAEPGFGVVLRQRHRCQLVHQLVHADAPAFGQAPEPFVF
ncbi:MAG: protein kinase [Acidobacteriia bacterium]|nr:protein kinase [Terriglobia bacterium]